MTIILFQFFYLIEQTAFATCQKPTIKNGNAKVRNRGKFIRYDCFRGFELYGSKYASCNNARWDTEIPICISNYYQNEFKNKINLF